MAVVWSGWMRYLLGGMWNPEVGQQRSGPGGYANDALQSVTDDRAMQISAVFRSIRLIAETCASMPLLAYQRQSDGTGKALPRSHPLSRLARKPNPTMTGEEWLESMFAQMAGWGNAYSEKVPNSLGDIVELWPYKVDRMEVTRLADRSLQYKYPAQFGQPAVLPAGRTLHLRMFTVDGVMGVSPLGVARESLGLAVGAERYAASFYANGGRPSGILTSDRILTDKQREQVQREFGGIASGGEDGKRLWVLEAALKYAPITVNPEDMQMISTRSFSIAEIARFFGVPLFLLGETEKSTSWGTGLEQMNLAFLIYTLRAYLDRMEAVWNDQIVSAADQAAGIYVEHDLSPLLRADSDARASYLSTEVQNGLMTRNEARRTEGRPAIDGGDELTVQVNLIPLSKLGQAPVDPAASEPPPKGSHLAPPAGLPKPKTRRLALVEMDN